VQAKGRLVDCDATISNEVSYRFIFAGHAYATAPINQPYSISSQLVELLETAKIDCFEFVVFGGDFLFTGS
jgi:hypothetical protein